MKRKLIELEQEALIECDNPVCSYVIPNAEKDPNAPIIQYLNQPCPECGENLLTEKDYLEAERFMRIVNWLNKYFSWVMYLFPKNVKKSEAQIKIHNGVKVKQL